MGSRRTKRSYTTFPWVGWSVVLALWGAPLLAVTFDAPIDLTVGTEPLGIRLADFDGDGRNDLAVVLDCGGRLEWEGPEEESLRIATWNIRWFPRGCPSASGCQENATDVDWLACTIAWMDLDLLALQEILDAPDARQQMGRLREELDELTDGN